MPDLTVAYGAGVDRLPRWLGAPGRICSRFVPIEPMRFSKLPDIPSMSEIIPAFRKPSSWFGFFAPPGTPAPIVARLHGQAVPLPPAPADERTDQNAADAADAKDN